MCEVAPTVGKSSPRYKHARRMVGKLHIFNINLNVDLCAVLQFNNTGFKKHLPVGMGAHSRQILRKQVSNRRRGRKHSEIKSDNGSWETGSATTCPENHKCEILENDQAHEGEIGESSEGICDFIRDTRIRPPSLLADNDGADIRFPYRYHPDIARPGLVGNLSASQEVSMLCPKVEGS